MKKVLLLIVTAFILCFIFSGCSEKNDEESTTTTTTQSVVESSTTETTTEKATEKQTEEKKEKKTSTTTTTKKNQNNPLISDEDIEKIENSNAEVFFTDNPNNKAIVAVSDKYGSKKENLVALVKVNAEFPSATVLEFSGKTENGELLMTYEELKYVYEINEEKNTIVKASKNGLDNDGVSFVEAKILITLTKEYFIPELPNLKANKRLPE